MGKGKNALPARSLEKRRCKVRWCPRFAPDFLGANLGSGLTNPEGPTPFPTIPTCSPLPLPASLPTCQKNPPPSSSPSTDAKSASRIPTSPTSRSRRSSRNSTSSATTSRSRRERSPAFRIVPSFSSASSTAPKAKRSIRSARPPIVPPGCEPSRSHFPPAAPRKS